MYEITIIKLGIGAIKWIKINGNYLIDGTTLDLQLDSDNTAMTGNYAFWNGTSDEALQD